MRGFLLAVSIGRPEATVLSATGLKSNQQIRSYIVTYFHCDPTTSSGHEYKFSAFHLVPRVSGVCIFLKDEWGARDL